MSKKFTSIVVTMLAMLVLFVVPVSAQKRPDPSMMKQSVLDRAKFDRKVSKRIHSTAQKMNIHQKNVPNARLVKRNNIKKADIKAAALNPLYGQMVYDSSWEEAQYGIYSMIPQAPANIEPVLLHNYLSDFNGGAIIDNKYYVHYYIEFWGMMFMYRECYDLETGEMVTLEDSEIDIPDLAQCCSFDASKGLSYGIYFDENGTASQIASYDYVTKTKVVIGTTANEYLVCAPDGKGSLFAITTSGELYKIDLSNGAETLVGNTGLIPMYLQSAAIDPSTGVMYWAFLDGMTSGLYQVNTETAEAAEIFPFTNLTEIVYLQSMAPEADNNAPAAVTDLTVSVADDNPNTLNVSFTMPTTTVAEEPLLGTLQYSIDLNGTVYTGEAQPGETVTRSFENLETAMYNIVVRAINSVGNGISAKTSIWVGLDLVKAPEFATLTVDENLLATVTWAPVTEGIHGGIVNPAEVTYRVVRYPEAEVVADGIAETTFSETVQLDPLRMVYYEITALFNGNPSQPTATNSVKVGSAIVPSYSYDFDGTQDALWTVLDANGDERSWYFGSGRAYYAYDSSNPADDWLLTPALSLKGGKAYLLSFDCWAQGSYYPERVEVGVGQGFDVTTYEFVIDPTDVTWASDDIHNLTATIKVPEDGEYYIGIHAISDPDMYYLNVDNFSLLDGSTPGAVTDVLAVAGDMGTLSATINFTSPTLTSGGEELTSISKIEVKRDGILVGTIENPSVGTELSVFDENLSASGIYTYTIQAFNESGAGVMVTTSVYVGFDVPAAPEVVARDDMPGITLTWNPASTVGANGGYVDPADVVYEIHDVVDGSIGDVIATVTENTWSDPSVNIDELPVGFVQYVIYPKNDVGEGEYGVGALIGGAPESMPFIDSFDLTEDGSLVHFWSISSPASSTTNWNITDEMSSDDDNICGYYTAGAAGDSGYLTTPRISLDGAVVPVALFKYYITPGTDIKLSFCYDKQDGNGPVVVGQVADGKDITDTGWKTAVVDLASLVGSTPVIFSYLAEAGEAGATVFVDEMKFGDVYAEDLAVAAVTAPKALQVGETGTVNVTVLNNGSNAVEAGAYSVKLFAGEKEVAEVTETPALDAYIGTGLVSMEYTALVTDASPLTLKAEVVYAKDLDLLNNAAQTNINVRQNKVDAVSDLAALTMGYPAVKLTWSEPKPQGGGAGALITEDFEDTDVFQDCDNGGIDFGIQTGMIGGWTLYDGDNYYSYGWNGVTFPGQDVPRAFIVFNPGNYFDLTEGSALVPYSGDQYMMSHDTATDENYNPIATDDWLISPELSGNAQTISFYATEITDQYGHESFEVLFSSTDTNPESFTKLYDGKASTEWEEVTVDLPQGAKYFAIRNISVDVFGLMIDDVTYEASATVAAAKGADAEVTGYNIYRDGQLIGSVDADVFEYIDVNETEGLHYYNVTALYGTIESPLSNTVSVVTAIEEIQTAEGLNDADITVYGANGAIIARGKGVYNTLRTGVYVIKNNETGAVRGISKK